MRTKILLHRGPTLLEVDAHWYAGRGPTAEHMKGIVIKGSAMAVKGPGSVERALGQDRGALHGFLHWGCEGFSYSSNAGYRCPGTRKHKRCTSGKAQNTGKITRV